MSASIWTAGHRGQARMAPTDFELGQQARRALWDFYGSTRTRGVVRDKTGVAMVRNQYPATRGLFSDAALAAVLREPQAGLCSWDAYRILAAANGEEIPAPTPALEGLLGSQCSRCRTYFEAREIAKREKALAASGYRRRVTGPQPTGRLWVDQQPAPVMAAAGPQLPVRDAIRLARQRQQQRESTYR